MRGVKNMLPLTLAKPGEINTIVRVGGNAETRKRLEDLGFHPGGTVQIISEINGNLIVNVKETRVAIDRALAFRIGI